MPQLTLDVPVATAARVFDAIAARKGYDPAADGTKAAFTKKFIIWTVMNEVRQYERGLAVTQATAATDAAVDAEIVIT